MPAPAATGPPGAGDLPAVRAPLFTGRDREQAALAAALAGPPAVALVEGEAGIGKTRLLREYLASGRGDETGTLVATCPPLARPQTLAPVAEAIRQAAPGGVAAVRLSGLAGALRPVFPEWADRLPPVPEPAEDASAARYRLFAALRELIERLDAGLLVVEDAHWADEATLEFVLYLASAAPRPISVVVTCRPEDVPPGSLLPRIGRLASGPAGLRLALGPLNVSQTAGMVASMLAGDEMSDEFVVFLHQRTEGVPLAVEETVRLLVGRDDLARPAGQWIRRPIGELQVPATIRDAVLERAGRLGAAARAVLEAAAVLAEPAADITLAGMTDLSAERLRAGLAPALACGLLEEDSRGLVSFRHTLAARAVYRAIPGPDRRVLHARAGRALENQSPPPLAALATHFREAGDTAGWVRYAEQAADLAFAAGDEVTTAALLCDLITRDGQTAREAARLAAKIRPISLVSDGQLRVLAGALRDLLGRQNLSPADEAAVRFQLGRILQGMFDWDAAQAEMQRAVPHLPARSLQRVRAMIGIGIPEGAGYPPPVRLRWLRRATQDALSLAGEERLRAALDASRALLLLGDEEGWAEAAQIPDEPSRIAERSLVTLAHMNVGDLAILWGQYAEADRQLGLAASQAERYGYHRLRKVIQLNQAHLDWCTGCWDGLAGRAAALAGDRSLPPVVLLELSLLGGLLDAAVGDYRRATERLGTALEGMHRLDNRCMMQAASRLAWLALADGRSRDADKITREPAAILARQGTWIWATELAPARVETLTASGQPDEAAALVAAFARGMRGRNAPAARAALIVCRVILAQSRGEYARAAGLAARAAAAWQALPRPHDALLARERQARCLLAAGRPEAGLELLAATRRELAALGAGGDAARVAGVLRAHGVVVPRATRGGRPGYGDRLSPRELEVARLAAAGRTNREIAQTLCRSPNTVGTQLTSVMRKLSVSSRTALAGRLAEIQPVAAGVPHDRADQPAPAR